MHSKYTATALINGLIRIDDHMSGLVGLYKVTAKGLAAHSVTYDDMDRFAAQAFDGLHPIRNQ